MQVFLEGQTQDPIFSQPIELNWMSEQRAIIWAVGVWTWDCSPCMVSSTQPAYPCSQSKLIIHSGPHPHHETPDWPY